MSSNKSEAEAAQRYGRSDDGCDYQFAVLVDDETEAKSPVRKTWHEAAEDCVAAGYGSWDRHVLNVTHGEIRKVPR